MAHPRQVKLLRCSGCSYKRQVDGERRLCASCWAQEYRDAMSALEARIAFLSEVLGRHGLGDTRLGGEEGE